jgi:hypothetical protein
VRIIARKLIKTNYKEESLIRKAKTTIENTCGIHSCKVPLKKVEEVRGESFTAFSGLEGSKSSLD